jgi:hypothetical protein
MTDSRVCSARFVIGEALGDFRGESIRTNGPAFAIIEDVHLRKFAVYRQRLRSLERNRAELRQLDACGRQNTGARRAEAQKRKIECC